MELTGEWSYPTHILFGPGRVAKLPAVCRDLGSQAPLLVTDPGLAGLSSVGDTLRRARDAGLKMGLFSAVSANPSATDVEAGVQAYRNGGHDCVVAFGGGSALDTGKTIALMVGQSRPIWDFEGRADWYKRANPDAIAPIIAVPTTSGTGSEVGYSAVITQPETHLKKSIYHPRLLARTVIADPELVIGLPSHLTAATGMDALSHCLEAFCTTAYHPMAEGIALAGMRLIHDWLPTATFGGDSVEARAHMMSASMMGAAAFSKGLGAMHAMSHPIGARYGAHHGLVNAIVMPYVLAYNQPAISERMETIECMLGLASPGFDGVLQWVLDLREQLSIPHTLADIGVTEDAVPALVTGALADINAPTNPRAAGEHDYAALFQAAIRGSL